MSENVIVESVEVPDDGLLRFVDDGEARAWQTLVISSLQSLNRSMPGTNITKPGPAGPVPADTTDIASSAVEQADTVIVAFRERNELLRRAWLRLQSKRAEE